MSRKALSVAVLVPLALLAAATASAATITSFSGTIGRASNLPYCYGSTLVISGSGFVTDGGVTGVSIGGVPAANFFVGSDSVVYGLVGPGATTGPVIVTTKAGSTTAPLPETITPCQSSAATVKPTVSSVSPKSTKGGKNVELFGSGFSGTTSVTVNGVAATYAIPSDYNLYVTIPRLAKPGAIAIVVTNAVGTAKTSVTKTL